MKLWTQAGLRGVVVAAAASAVLSACGGGGVASAGRDAGAAVGDAASAEVASGQDAADAEPRTRKDVASADAQPADAQELDIQQVDIQQVEVQPVDAHEPDMQQFDIQQVDLLSVDAQEPDSQQVDIQQVDVQPVDALPAPDSADAGGGATDAAVEKDSTVEDIATAADAGQDSAVAPDAAPGTSPPPPPPLPPSVCDAGDHAWSARAVQVLTGRKPWSMAEVGVLVQLIKASDRATVAKALLQTPEAKSHWVERLYSLSHIYRSGHQVNAGCYQTTTPAGDSSELAKFIRDNPPTKAMPMPGATMADVARSAIALDDMSPWFDAQLFAMIGRPASFCKNVDEVEMDRLRRVGYGERFMAQYMNRNLGCLSCHNSGYSTTYTSDPATNRFWAIPGKFESTLLGKASGVSETVAYQALRLRGVLSRKSIVEVPEQKVWPEDPKPPVRPWQWAEGCGQFLAKGDVDASLDGSEGFLGGNLGVKGSIWDVEARLRAGLSKLAADGDVPDTTAVAADPDRALAYLLATRVVSDLWSQIYGAPLTIGHRFPRDVHQRDLLVDLSRKLIASHWSLQKVLAAMVTEPGFNELPASAGCGKYGPYSLAPIFDAFSTNNDLPMEQGNSPADGLHREQALTLVRMAAFAAGWQVPGPMPFIAGAIALDDSIGFPQPLNLNEFAFRIGAFLDDARPGTDDMDPSGFALWRSLVASCRVQLPDGQVISSDAGPDGDFIDQLLAAAKGPSTTVGDVVAAIRDRLINEPDIPPGELPATLALFGVPTGGTLVTEVPDLDKSARAYCGAVLASPQFWLTGVPGPAQQTRAKLAVLPTATFQANCKALAPLVFPTVDYDVVCDAATLTVTAKGKP